MYVCNSCQKDTAMHHDRWCIPCNDKLAAKIDEALKTDDALPEGWKATAINMGNVNFDIKIIGPDVMELWFFRYHGIFRARKKIEEIGVREYAKQFVLDAIKEYNHKQKSKGT